MKWPRNKNKNEFTPLLEQKQAEKLAELGTQLRLNRQEQNLSLEQVAAKTRIRWRLLQAIEQAQIDELPESIYIQSLIKQYADTLGLNGAELSNAFPTTGDASLSIKPSQRKLPAVQLRLRPIHLYVLYILVVICPVNGLSQTLRRSELQANITQSSKKPLAPSASKQDRVLPQSEKLKFLSATPSAATEISRPVRIDVTLKAQSWMRVVADGKTQFEGILPEGTQRTWVAQEQLTLRAGNAGGVLVTSNQEEKPKQMGAPGEVEEVTFAANTRI